MNFEEALNLLKAGRYLQRTGWNGQGMYVYLVPARGPYLAHLMLHTARFEHVPWLASQTDLLSDDWKVYEDQDWRIER